MHAKNAFVTKQEQFKGLEIPHVITAQQTVIFVNPEKEDLDKIQTYVSISTNYFGGFGEQSAKMFRDGKLELESKDDDSINKCLRLIGIAADGTADEFDIISLGNYRTEKDIIDEWSKTKGTYIEEVETASTINDMNRAFALFEGATEILPGVFKFPSGKINTINAISAGAPSTAQMPLIMYHHSWDWLVPFIVKITETVDVFDDVKTHTVSSIFEELEEIEFTPVEAQKYLYTRFIKK